MVSAVRAIPAVPVVHDSICVRFLLNCPDGVSTM